MISTLYTELRNELGVDRAEAAEIMTDLRDGDTDDSVESCGYLFVPTENLPEYLAEHLSNDEYCLGCFADWFVARELDIDVSVIRAMQDAEAYEAVGKLILSKCDMVEFAESAASADGYGHFLNSHDGTADEVGQFTAFRQ